MPLESADSRGIVLNQIATPTQELSSDSKKLMSFPKCIFFDKITINKDNRPGDCPDIALMESRLYLFFQSK